jgi:peptidoglycan/LPS O-acetylase OafA/YrhL
MQRQSYLDWLRILAILGVLFFHSAMPYATELDWHIRNKETSNLLLEMNVWMHMFRMPLLFFISGTVSYYMLQNRTGKGFIGLRFTRLFIPLVFGMLVIVPPQVYMERLTQGFKGNFWHFYPSIFTTGAYPKGNMSWHHLWFILYLLIYDIIFAPLFVWIINAKNKPLQWMAEGKRIYLLTIPAIIIYSSMTIKFPETNNLVQDYCYFLYWLCFMLVGFICVANTSLMDSLERNRRFSLMIAFISIMVINYIRWNDRQPWDTITNWQTDPRTYAFLALRVVCAWGWVLTAIGYGKRYLNKKHPVLNYLNQAVYPFYILHQTIIVILTYYVVQTTETIGMKYTFTVIVTFLISMSIFHIFIRPYAVTRFLFGMKAKQKPTRQAADKQPVIQMDVQPVI